VAHRDVGEPAEAAAAGVPEEHAGGDRRQDEGQHGSAAAEVGGADGVDQRAEGGRGQGDAGEAGHGSAAAEVRGADGVDQRAEGGQGQDDADETGHGSAAAEGFAGGEQPVRPADT
jgi:hypothetical protein